MSIICIPSCILSSIHISDFRFLGHFLHPLLLTPFPRGAGSLRLWINVAICLGKLQVKSLQLAFTCTEAVIELHLLKRQRPEESKTIKNDNERKGTKRKESEEKERKGKERKKKGKKRKRKERKGKHSKIEERREKKRKKGKGKKVREGWSK